ncbi:Stealth CR1 domain-containing protein [Ectothiorhodospira magna]|nr:Stealth CR1 domain-containing protein [Ectothiorhodospira magna]
MKIKKPQNTQHEIDAVITWVDGEDPVHFRKRLEALNAEKKVKNLPIAAGRDPTRFKDNGEIVYCIKLLRGFAPWIRTIHLVTDGQCPAFLDSATRKRLGVKIVDHKTIFQGYESVLPTFNSITIETALWRIPGLARRFLYLNDDFFLIQPVQPEDFFLGDCVVLRGRWKLIQRFGPMRIKLSIIINHFAKTLFGINRAMSLLQQMKAAQLAGARYLYYKTPHAPHALHRETLANYFKNHPDHFAENIRYSFRDASQFVATFLAHHLEIGTNNAKLISDHEAVMICFNRESHHAICRKLKQLHAEECKYRFLCVQSLEEASSEHRKTVIRFLDSRLTAIN